MKLIVSDRLLLTDRQVVSRCKTFANKSLAKIKFSKTQITNIIQSGGFLGRFLRPSMKVSLPLMKMCSGCWPKSC